MNDTSQTIADMRDIARRIFLSGVAAADPDAALTRALDNDPLPRPAPGGRLVLVAIGKAAPRMMQAAMRALPDGTDRIALVVTHHENTDPAPGARLLKSGHPVPDEAGLIAAREVTRLLETCTAADRVVALISGGGSALLPAPAAGLTLEDKKATGQALLGAGLDIVAMNLVRQQLSALKGGGFLQCAAPAPVTAYLLSDVIGDDLRAIASGPTVGPIGSRSDAQKICRDAGIWDRLPAAVRAHLAAPTEDAPPLPHARNILIGSNRQSLAAMHAAARDDARWDSHIVSDALCGDVADAAAQVLAEMTPRPRPTALLFGGETTVTLRGSGRGGRNQELSLRVALGALDPGAAWVFLSGGTDGRDGPTDAAGGIVDAGTAARIAQAGGDGRALLANNDSFAALKLAQDLLITAATGTNVADLQVLLISARR